MGVPDPHAVGKDRLVDAAYAAANFPLPVITVDLGTATTFNVVDENRVFRGRCDLPGAFHRPAGSGGSAVPSCRRCG